MNKKEIQLILEEGEGYKIEFKENLSGIEKELVAFANSSGGKIFLGITDDKKIKGGNINNKLKSQIQDVANNCEPSIKILFEQFENILIINVKEGTDKPYKCSSGFYTRIGPNSQKMRRNEIIDFFKSEGKIRFDELINLKFDYRSHFDEAKLDKFLLLAGIPKILETPDILVNLGVAEKQEGKLIFNNTGILFFAKNLNDIYHHTTVTCALYKGTEKVNVLDRKDFNEDIVSNINDTMNFLKKYIPVKYEMTGTPRRKEIPEIPYDVLREAIINAVAHRDYFEKGTNVMMEMFDDRIEISDFGGLPKGLNPEDFGKKSVLRNPNIADLLHRIEYIEKMGTGINKIKSLLREAKLPKPEFEFGTFFTVIFRKPIQDATINEGINDAISEAISEAINESVSETVKDRLILEITYIYNNNPVFTELKKFFGMSRATVQRDLIILKKAELIRFEGAKKTGKYVLTEKGKKMYIKVVGDTDSYFRKGI